MSTARHLTSQLHSPKWLREKRSQEAENPSTHRLAQEQCLQNLLGFSFKERIQEKRTYYVEDRPRMQGVSLKRFVLADVAQHIEKTKQKTSQYN